MTGRGWLARRLGGGTVIAACLVILAAGCRRPAATAAAAADSAWVASATIYEVFVQDFSPEGNLRGVLNGLDRIAAAGANVVWLMPIHPYGVERAKPPLGSPYAVRDYRAVNPAFGTHDDFRALVDSVHARGMKLILDWVPDHTAWDHAWITQHPGYYVKNERGEISHPRDAQGNLTDWTDVAQLDYRNPELRRVMIEEMTYWLTEFGIDGYRVDVAGFVPADFWREALPRLRAAANKPIMLLAEWGTLEMHRVGFDLSYGWDGYSRLKNVWAGASADSFVRAELREQDSMPAGGLRLRFTTNHDETSWDNPPVVRFNGSAGARAAFVAMALLPGRPMLYAGQEVESPQKLNLFQREAVIWDQPNADSTRAFYRRVMELSRRQGALRRVSVTDSVNVIAYQRDSVLVLVNTRQRPASFTVTGPAVDGLTDLLTGAPQRGRTVTLPAYGAVVLAPAPGP